MDTLIRITTVPVSLEKLLEGQLNFMQKEYEVIAVSSDEKELKNLGKRIGVDTFAVEMTRSITPVKDLKSVWDLYHFFKRVKPLIVHTHTPKAGIVGMLAAKMAGVPIRLHTLAGLPQMDARKFKWKVLREVEKITFSCATRIYPNSPKMYEYLLRENYVVEDKLKVLGNGSSNGIDITSFNPENYSPEQREDLRRSLSIDIQDLVFIFVGRLVADKGINELVEAFEKVNKEFPATSLLLVGNFEDEFDPLQEITVTRMKNHQKIIEAGYQKDVRPYFACADVLVFPSYREGFPNVVMQAGAMNLPSIVTNINGCNEIIKEEVNGIIVPVRDVEGLTVAMSKIIKDNNLRNFLTKNARRIIAENYRREKIWNALLSEYKQLEIDIK